ncbi:hypothetical protein GCM10028799_29150 [Kribbella italica]
MAPARSDEELMQAIREIMAGPYNADYVVHAIRQLLEPEPEPREVRKDRRGWIEFADAVIELPDDGTAWERHDDPEQNR